MLTRSSDIRTFAAHSCLSFSFFFLVAMIYGLFLKIMAYSSIIGLTGLSPLIESVAALSTLACEVDIDTFPSQVFDCILLISPIDGLVKDDSMFILGGVGWMNWFDYIL